MLNIPTLFTDKKILLSYDYDQLKDLVDTDIDHSEHIENLSVPGDKGCICKDYFKTTLKLNFLD